MSKGGGTLSDGQTPEKHTHPQLSDRENNLRSRELVFKRNSERTQTWSSLENKDILGHGVDRGSHENQNMDRCSPKWKRRKMQTDKKFDGTMGKNNKKFWQDYLGGFWGKWANRLQVQAETPWKQPLKQDLKFYRYDLRNCCSSQDIFPFG